ncbi:MAG TPA: hypothetical protein VJY47_02745 [Candidatus Dojkabacteria bacterium]|nr:hypothetical protein [Candidatus Dojkabacteria bacterium]
MIKLLVRIAYFLSILVQATLGIRIILVAIHAENSSNALVQWIMTKTDFLIAPFKGIVDSTINIGSVQIPTILVVALVFYIIVGIVLSELLKSYRDND